MRWQEWQVSVHFIFIPSLVCFCQFSFFILHSIAKLNSQSEFSLSKGSTAYSASRISRKTTTRANGVEHTKKLKLMDAQNPTANRQFDVSQALNDVAVSRLMSLQSFYCLW